MNNKMLFYVIVYLVGVIVSSFAQILLKKSSEKTYDNPIREYLNPYVIISYGIFFGATLFSIFAYKEVPLSLGPILAASEYIFVAILSLLFLKEKINKKKALGLTVIVIGTVICSL